MLHMDFGGDLVRFGDLEQEELHDKIAKTLALPRGELKVTRHQVDDLCSYGVYSYDLYSYGICSCGLWIELKVTLHQVDDLYSYGLCSYGICSSGLWS